MIDKLKSLKDCLRGYLSWAKAHPLCAEGFYNMAQGYASGACMALLCAGKSDEYEEIENLWNNELKPAFDALLKQE